MIITDTVIDTNELSVVFPSRRGSFTVSSSFFSYRRSKWSVGPECWRPDSRPFRHSTRLEAQNVSKPCRLRRLKPALEVPAIEYYLQQHLTHSQKVQYKSQEVSRQIGRGPFLDPLFLQSRERPQRL